MGATKGGWRAKLAGVLFGGFFAAFGVGFLVYSVVPALYDYWQVQGWQAVSAELLDTALDSHQSDNTTTYSVSARYRYRWQGRDYIGERVGIDTGSDNIGNWHKQHYFRLQRALDTGRRITVWVNPAAPQQSLIDRQMRWGLFGFKMIFVVIFGGVGFGIIIFALRQRAASGDSATAAWLDNPAWRDNRIRSGGKALLWFLWVFGILWLLFMIPMWMNAERLLDKGLPVALLPYLLPLIGLLVLVQAVIRTLRWHRFGDATLSLDPFPGECDGKVAGRIEVPLAPGEPVQVRLSCIHVYWRRTGNKRERREEILWQDSRQVQAHPGPRGAVVAFAFRPDPGLPPSSSGREHHKWVVDVRAKLAGPDLEHRFTIPVFARQGQRESLETDFVLEDTSAADVLPSSSRVEPNSPGPAVLPAWVKLANHGGAVELVLPMFRNLALSLPLLLVGGIFAAVGFFLLQDTAAPFFFGPVFLLIGGGLFLGGIYSLGNALRVRVSPRGVELERRIFGLPLRRRIGAMEVRSLEKHIGARTGSQAFYRVRLVTRHGKRITLADSLPGASAADYLIGQLERRLWTEGARQGAGRQR